MSVSIRQLLGLLRQHTDQFHVNPLRLHSELLPAMREMLYSLDKSTLGSYQSSHFAHAYKTRATRSQSSSLSDRGGSSLVTPHSFGPKVNHIQSPIIWSTVSDEQWFTVDLFRMYEGSRMALHNHPSMFVVNLMLEGRLRYTQLHCPVNDYVLGLDSSSHSINDIISDPSLIKDEDRRDSDDSFSEIESEAQSHCSWESKLSWMDSDSSHAERSENEIILGDIKRSIFAKCVVCNQLTDAQGIGEDGPISEIHGNYGNLHELYAESDCSVLSFLIPGYNQSNRKCTWFKPMSMESVIEGERHSMVESEEVSRVQKVRYEDIQLGDWVRLKQFNEPPECCNAGDFLFAYDGQR